MSIHVNPIKPLTQQIHDHSTRTRFTGLGSVGLPLAPSATTLRQYDYEAFTTINAVFDYELIFSEAALLVDIRGRAKEQTERVFRV